MIIQTITTGRDPRNLPEFRELCDEIIKASHPTRPVINWAQVESLALTIFKTNGVDLQTATYYTLARTLTQGLDGFCEGVELIAALTDSTWDQFWPKEDAARVEILEWFTTHTGMILREQLVISATDAPLLYRAEQALQVICNKLKQAELKRMPRIESLLCFVQNEQKRYKQSSSMSKIITPEQTTVSSLLFVPKSSDAMTTQVPSLAEVKMAVRTMTMLPQSLSKAKQKSALHGFLLGILFSVTASATVWWWKFYPQQQQIVAVKNTAQGAATIWLTAPQLYNYQQRLQQLTGISPLHFLEMGQRIRYNANKLWPESPLQQHATAEWDSALKIRASNSPQMLGWQQTLTDLNAFSRQLIEREQAHKGITLSYIKTFIYQADRKLSQETPLEYLLTQYQQSQSAGKNTDRLEKQINDRLDGVLSRWLLLSQNRLNNTTDDTSK